MVWIPFQTFVANPDIPPHTVSAMVWIPFQTFVANPDIPPHTVCATLWMVVQTVVATPEMVVQTVEPTPCRVDHTVEPTDWMVVHVSPPNFVILLQASPPHLPTFSKTPLILSLMPVREKLSRKARIFCPISSPSLEASSMPSLSLSACSASPELDISKVLSLSKPASPAEVASTTSPMESAASFADSDDDLKTSPNPRKLASALMPLFIHSTTCLSPSMTGWTIPLMIPHMNERSMRIFSKIHVMPSTTLETIVMMPLTSGAVKDPIVVFSFLTLFCICPAALE